MSPTEAAAPSDLADAGFGPKEQAAEWVAVLRSGDAADMDRRRWEAWLAASEEHRKAWAYVELVSRRFAPIQASPDPRAAANVLQTAGQRLVRRRRALVGVAAVGVTGLLSWATWRRAQPFTPLMAWMADHHTGVGETRQLTLADGTRVWLGPSSAFSEDFRPELRRLQLVTGDIFIETAADATRPFVVDTPHGRLRALGTRFNVRLDDRQTVVSVYEGAVQVRTAASDASSVVRAGEQTGFDRQAIDVIVAADPSREGWMRGVLIAQDMLLSEVVAELERYRHGHLGVAPEVAGLRVYGSFPLDDSGRALAMLQSVLPIQVRQPLPWWTTLAARSGAGGESSTH
jgi:transmembrane sensor